MKLMIVEENHKMCDLLKTLFRRNFDGFIECDNVKDILNTYKASRPDWVFIDLDVKESDGIAATRLLRQSFPGARILVFSDYGDDNLRCDASLAGASGYVMKDNLQEIYKMITL